MKLPECEFEAEALAAALESRWPDRVDASLRSHAASCRICAEVIAVAAALEEARRESSAQAVVPDSGRLWWRAQLRARREAAQAAGRPITAAQAIAFASAMGLLGACFGAVSTWFQAALALAASSLAEIEVRANLSSAVGRMAEHGVLLLAISAAVLLVPAALYFALGRE